MDHIDPAKWVDSHTTHKQWSEASRTQGSPLLERCFPDCYSFLFFFYLLLAWTSQLLFFFNRCPMSKSKTLALRSKNLRSIFYGYLRTTQCVNLCGQPPTKILRKLEDASCDVTLRNSVRTYDARDFFQSIFWFQPRTGGSRAHYPMKFRCGKISLNTSYTEKKSKFSHECCQKSERIRTILSQFRLKVAKFSKK